MKNKYLSLVILLLITFIAPMIGSYATSTFKEPWYSEIILPSFNPPSRVFAPVWTTPVSYTHLTLPTKRMV